MMFVAALEREPLATGNFPTTTTTFGGVHSSGSPLVLMRSEPSKEAGNHSESNMQEAPPALPEAARPYSVDKMSALCDESHTGRTRSSSRTP